MRDMTKSFSIDFTSSMTGERYMGTFTVKKLTIRDLSRLGHRKAQLCGGFSYDGDAGTGVDSATAMLNEMIAHCEIALISKPEWFDAEKLTDLEVLNRVYEEVSSFEVNFLRNEPQAEGKEAAGSSQVPSGDEFKGSGGPTHSTQDLVDKKIPKISPLA
jgi:hypothetical protein